MAIKRLGAVDAGGSYEFTVWLDDTKTIPDPACCLTILGEPDQIRALLSGTGAVLLSEGADRATILRDPQALLPDPAGVQRYTVGKSDGEGNPMTPEMAWATVREEAESQAGTLLTRGQELVLNDDPESAGDLAAQENP